ncbi:MAG TPA: LysM peptidoglycan-binding domain-containing protein [Flavobacterium sp.]|nr:LysM peptidoglycan-binding domain-containing protein [Flavobacterium sp.]
MFNSYVFSQEKNIIKYTVLKGETITQISQKYKITPYDIYKLNPDSQNGIKENDILLIPATSVSDQNESKPKTQTTSNKKITHIVKPKETLYSLSRDYNVSVEDIKEANKTELVNGLKIGQEIIIPSGQSLVAVESTPVKASSSSTETIYHIVEPKETKFGISKKYDITIEELERLNPEIVSNLPVGYNLIIKGTRSKSDEKSFEELKPKPAVQEKVVSENIEVNTNYSTKKNGYANYEVKSGQTLYSLSQMFNISQEELIELNPTLKNGVKEGMILKVPGQGSIVKKPIEPSKFNDLSNSINTKTKKELVLLIPFNLNKQPLDSIKALDSKLKKDAFLNMTLDFYSGALMAIDSAKALKLNLKVRIFDSEETKMTSNVEKIVKDNKLQDSDAVIGPFYQQNVEKVASMLNDYNVPVISPLSKEVSKPFNNLYQVIPSGNLSKKVMMDYLVSNDGNIIVVISAKKVADREMISSNYPNVKFAETEENGSLSPEKFKSLFVNGKMNYVILVTEKTSLILETTNIMLKEYSNYKMQLVILESNDTLDFEEVSMKRLTVLKMIYPSLTRENESPEAIAFRNRYKKKYKVFPSTFAMRGFDITFDTMLRLSQNESFETSAKNDKTQQIVSKFEYVKSNSQENVNNGIYILQYQEDYTVKQLN